jgi:Protein of unknown function (DUF3800)
VFFATRFFSTTIMIITMQDPRWNDPKTPPLSNGPLRTVTSPSELKFKLVNDGHYIEYLLPYPMHGYLYTWRTLMTNATIPYSASLKEARAKTSFCHLLDAILRDGGYVVEFVEAYFDESGSDDKSSVLCVAGYIIEKNAAAEMDVKWLDVLEKFNLPFFRMSACAHGSPPFDNMTKDERIEVEKQMIAIIKSYTTYGIAVTVEPHTFAQIMPELPEAGSAYSFCAHTCLVGVKWWANQHKYRGDIAYFFESGHRSQSEANNIMNKLFDDPQQRADHRYASHTFADKAKARPLQAADLLAWQWHTDRKRPASRGRPRLDLQELVRDQKPPHHALHYDANLLRGMRDKVLSRRFPLTFPYPEPWR